MISLLKLSDDAGKKYSYGPLILALENGVKIYENADNAAEAIVWVPEALRPYEFEWSNMWKRVRDDEKIRAQLFWPEKILRDNAGQYCGYVTKNPEVKGQLISVKQWIEKERSFDEEEKRSNVIIGSRIAQIFKVIHDKSGYILGIISPESFWMDEALNVYYVESFDCAKNLQTEDIKSCYIAPELLMAQSEKTSVSIETDDFIYALLLFQILTGRFPYGGGRKIENCDVDEIWNLMCDGISVFYDRMDQEREDIMNLLESYSARMAQLFRQVFDYCGRSDYAEGRPSIDDWMETLSDYEITHTDNTPEQ